MTFPLVILLEDYIMLMVMSIQIDSELLKRPILLCPECAAWRALMYADGIKFLGGGRKAGVTPPALRVASTGLFHVLDLYWRTSHNPKNGDIHLGNRKRQFGRTLRA